MRRQATRADGQHVLPFSRDSVAKVLPAAERWRREADLLSLSTKARLRLEWIIFYRTIAGRSARKTARYFGISPQTVCEWVDRFGDRDLRGLEDQPSTPKRRRSWQPEPLVLERMLALRREYPEWGKETLAAVYRERYGEAMSSWQFQRMISLFRMGRRKRKQHRGSRSTSPKQRISYAARREAKELWQLDTVVVRVDGQSRYVLTGLEHATKLGYAFAYERATSRAARDFLERLRYLMGSRIGVILTDNGSEFAGRFERACQEAEVTRFYSRPRRPTDNPECERFNQTLQREWLDQQNATPDLTMLNFSLERWLETYNAIRPHHALGLRTPLAVADEVGALSRTSPSATGEQKER